jgi:hypothetical protein
VCRQNPGRARSDEPGPKPGPIVTGPAPGAGARAANSGGPTPNRCRSLGAAGRRV